MSFIYVPFSYLMKGCLFIAGNSYLFALFFFALVMQIILLPLAIKQQKSQIMMAKVRPKEMAIREKYKGRNDRVTQQKMTMEIQEMYQQSGYNQFSGCLPLLIQLPIILILFAIVRQPITYATNLPDSFVSDNVSSAIDFYIAERDSLDKSKFESESDYNSAVSVINGYLSYLGAKDTNDDNVLDSYSGTPGQYADTELSRLIIDGREDIEELKDYFTNYDEIIAKYESTGLEAHKDDLPNYRVFSINLLDEPTMRSVLVIIPILVFITSFIGTKLTRRFSGSTQTDANGNPIGGGLFMEVGMPLISAIFAFNFSGAIGVYWIWRTLIGMAQTLILAKAMPIPQVTEEQIAEAKREMKSKVKKKKVITIEVDEDDNSYDDLVVQSKGVTRELDPEKRTPRRIEMLTVDDEDDSNNDSE